MSSLEHLQKLEVGECKNMEEIISNQREIEATNEKIMFHALRHLVLKKLPSLKAFSQSHYNLDFPSLKKVDIEDCPNMKVFSRGDSYTRKLEDLNIKIESLSSNYTVKKDINSIIQGFESFVASQGLEMLNWTKLHNEGYFIKNSKTDIKAFHKLLVLVPSNEIQMLQNVTELTLRMCRSLVEVFGSGGEGTKECEGIIHYQLQKLELINLHKLSHIWKHNITEVVSFQNLKDIGVTYCHNLKSLLSQSMAKSLVQRECESLEEIFESNDSSMKYHELRFIDLFSLPKLKHIWKNHGQISGFQELARLHIKKCDELRCVFWDVSMATSLPNLMNLLVCECRKMEEIIGNNNNSNPNNCVIEQQQKAKIIFPKLWQIRLEKLPSLKWFCQSSFPSYVDLPKWFEIIITDCPEIKTFWLDGTLYTPKLKYLYVDSTKFDKEEDVNVVIQQHKK